MLAALTHLLEGPGGVTGLGSHNVVVVLVGSDRAHESSGEELGLLVREAVEQWSRSGRVLLGSVLLGRHDVDEEG